jgi:hypothetical protein
MVSTLLVELVVVVQFSAAHSGSEVHVKNQDVKDDGIEMTQLVKKYYGKRKQVFLQRWKRGGRCR